MGPRLWSKRSATVACKEPSHPASTLGSLLPNLPSTPSTGTPESPSPTYEEFLEDIKGRIRSAQARAARAINAELIDVYWQIGYEILRRQTAEGNRRGRGGPKIVERLSADLRAAFPGARGFSVRSLRYMRAFAVAWPEREMLQSDIAALPWAHVTLLLDKLSDRPTRDWYAARASSWSKAELEHHIASRLHERQAAAITNFERALLFYHHPTRRFVVIDLKMGPFKAEFAGKMNLYVNAVNELIANDEDRATVGFILCTARDEAVAHLTLQGISTPIAVTRYTVGERGVLMADEESQITEGIEDEMEGMRRVEQQVAEFAARRARELAEGEE